MTTYLELKGEQCFLLYCMIKMNQQSGFLLKKSGLTALPVRKTLKKTCLGHGKYNIYMSSYIKGDI